MMGQPGTALRTIVVSAGRPDLERELLFPVHALRTIGNAEAIRNAEAAMGVDLLPGQLVGADVETAPTLRIGDEAGDRHRPLHHHRQRLAFRDVLPVARPRTLDPLCGVMFVRLGQLLLAITARRAGLDLTVLGALLARMVALGAEAPAVCAGDEIALL